MVFVVIPLKCTDYQLLEKNTINSVWYSHFRRKSLLLFFFLLRGLQHAIPSAHENAPGLCRHTIPTLKGNNVTDNKYRKCGNFFWHTSTHMHMRGHFPVDQLHLH